MQKKTLRQHGVVHTPPILCGIRYSENAVCEQPGSKAKYFFGYKSKYTDFSIIAIIRHKNSCKLFLFCHFTRHRIYFQFLYFRLSSSKSRANDSCTSSNKS